MEKRTDDRDSKKSDDQVIRKETDESMEMADLQVGEEDERANPDRFVPDPKAEPPGEKDDTGS
jgi:hypothetical protein